MWAAFGIVSSLFSRELTGEGDRVELGMLDATLPWLTKQAGKSFVGEEPKRMGTKKTRFLRRTRCTPRKTATSTSPVEISVSGNNSVTPSTVQS